MSSSSDTATDCASSRAWYHSCDDDEKQLNGIDNALNIKLNPLAEEINMLDNRLTALDIETMIGDSRSQLEQWRVDCYTLIDRYFDKKCQELDEYVIEKVEKQREEIRQMRSKMAILIDDQAASQQDLESLTSTIRDLERQMKTIERTTFQVVSDPFCIDESLIDIEEHFELATLSPPFKTIHHSGKKSWAMASNEQFLLVHQDPNLCLINQEFELIKQIPWEYDWIIDLCWSSTLALFIAVTINGLFLIDDNTLSIQSIKTVAKENWWSCACSNNSLFLSIDKRGSSIMEFHLSPLLPFIKQWKSPITCRKQEVIDSMTFNNGMLALIIRNYSNQTKRIEQRLSTTFDRLWSVPLDIYFGANITRCCLFNRDDWLVIDEYTSCIIHVTQDGYIKKTCECSQEPYCANLFLANTLAISTEHGLTFHQV